MHAITIETRRTPIAIVCAQLDEEFDPGQAEGGERAGEDDPGGGDGGAGMLDCEVGRSAWVVAFDGFLA